MTEKDRILELVKKGVISSGEAIELLEQIGQKKASNEPVEEYIEEIPAKNADYYEKVDKKRLNTILGDLANAVTSMTRETNEVDRRITNLEKSIAEKQERLTELQTLASIDQLTVDDEMELQRITEVLDSLIDQLESLEIQKQQATEEKIRQKKAELNDKYKQVKEKVKETNWEEKAGQSVGVLTNAVESLTNKVSKVVKEAGDSVEWQDKKVRVPKIASVLFEHTITSEPTAATIIDVKVANGEIVLNTWDEDYVKIIGKYKIYGNRPSNITPLEMLQERSTIEINDEKVIYHVPNKRVSCDVEILVPKNHYDYVKAETLNANLAVSNMTGKDYYTKIKNGNLSLHEVSGSMLEIDLMNGDIAIDGGGFRDIFAKTINGDISIDSDVISYDVTTVNGDIDLAVETIECKKINANTTNGDIGIDLIDELSIEAMLKTSFGEVEYDKEIFETIMLQKELVAKVVQIKSMKETVPVTINAVTISGDIEINQL